MGAFENSQCKTLVPKLETLKIHAIAARIPEKNERNITDERVEAEDENFAPTV